MSGKLAEFLIGHDFLVRGAVVYLLAGVLTLVVVYLLGYFVRPEWLR